VKKGKTIQNYANNSRALEELSTINDIRPTELTSITKKKRQDLLQQNTMNL